MNKDKTFNTGETAAQLKALYNPEGSAMRRAQMRMLEMLTYIDDICRSQNIDYYIEAGTMLGAYRHGGFIPWDDDADIMMTKENFARLKAYMLAHPHPHYVLQNHQSDPHYYGFWEVLRDTKSEYLQDSPVHKTRKYRGCQIDIFTCENYACPSVHFLAAGVTFLNQKLFIGRCNAIAALVYHTQRLILHPICRLLSRIFGKKDMYMYSMGIIFKEQTPAHIVNGKPEDIEFEGVTLKSPSKPIEYLEHQFGKTWNELPPKENRLGHETQVVFYD